VRGGRSAGGRAPRRTIRPSVVESVGVKVNCTVAFSAVELLTAV
jgi:hypothetical protein